MENKAIETHRILQYDQFLDDVSRKLSFSQINPTNAVEEKEKFLADKTYNPQFRYMNQTENYDEITQQLEIEQNQDSIISKLLNEKRIEYLKKIKMFSKIGTDEFSNNACEVYGVPDDFLIQKAKEFITLEPESTCPQLSTEEVKKYFKMTLQHYGFDWSIVEKPMVAGSAVSPSKKTVFIREGSTFSMDFIKRLIVHEIGTHVLRAENGSKQPYTIFRRGLPGYMSTEEGLAVVNEEICGVLNHGTLKVYAGRVLAIHSSLHHSFSEVFSMLSEYFNDNIAWRLTLRAKRGLSDTSRPGSFTKDYLYLDGYFKVKKYIEQGKDISKLYSGKIGIQHVDMVEEMNNLDNTNFHPKDILKEVIICQQ